MKKNKLRRGKPVKFVNFVQNFLGLVVPDGYYRKALNGVLAKASKRSDFEYMKQRVDYYNKKSEPFKISSHDNYERERSWIHYTGTLGGYKRKMFHTAYFFDQHDVMRWFNKALRWNFCPGDVYFTPDVPTIVKSRLLQGDNSNSVVLKLDKLRHFMFVKDDKRFEDKKDCAIFRGKIRQSRLRTEFLNRYFGHPLCDAGVVGRNEGCPEEWMTEKKSIQEHLDYKFIIALEGNDVASNLKWVMSSHSLAVMTRPTCETWFMEGTLIPDYHYVEVKEDFSDFEEKLNYYIAHPNEANEIIQHAHDYVEQFFDEERETMIQLMVMEKYFKQSGQM